MEHTHIFIEDLLSHIDSLDKHIQENMFLTISSLLRQYPELTAKDAQEVLLHWLYESEDAMSI